jgi:hypothetical protein
MRPPTLAVLCAAILALSGCAGQHKSAARSSTPATSAASAAPTTAAALDGCVQPGMGRLVPLGASNQAAVLGSGPVGVVLSNQSDQDLCGWLPFGRTLAAHGFRVLLYDYGANPAPSLDVATAAGKLRSLGVRTVLLIGASEGAKASLIAAPQLRPAVAGVVSLSAERTERGVDVLPWAARLRSPVLFFTAKDDSYAAEPTPQLYKAAAKAASRQLVTLPGFAHGTDLLTGPTGPKVQAAILDFLRRYGHAG